MRSYEKVKDVFGKEVIKATEGERILWIPLDPRNSDYAEYLRYTAWVEAGNTPEDFWTQDDELEMIEPSEPKEEEETTEGES